MSENIPESIPTSRDHHSSRPTKRRALSPRSKQATQLDALFAQPDKPISVPNTSAPKLSRQPPEIVANVQGSSAGAGSGEFHVYKASRRREYERLRAMSEEKEKEEKDAEFVEKKKEIDEKDRQKTDKNRLKREKARLRKEKAKVGGDKEEKKEKERKFVPNVGVQREKEGEEFMPVVEEQGITFHDED